MGQTPTWGLPYPEQDTLITDSAAIVQELAEKIDTALSAVTSSDAYTVPGTLIANMTTSGTFTPPAGVTVVHVVIIGGGARGQDNSANAIRAGGSGGAVRVHRGVEVSGDIPVVIGGSATASSFGALTAREGYFPTDAYDQTWSPNMVPTDDPTRKPSAPGYGYPSAAPGYDGVVVNGTYYAGGGGGGGNWYANNTSSKPGGAGGGGNGAGTGINAGRGGNGLGGGGGGGYPTVVGGSGRVMVYTEQTPLATLNLPATNPDPLIVAALDDQGAMTGAYAVDAATRELPVPGVRVIDYPTEPVDTGRTEIALVDPENPTGPTTVVPVLAWPEAGWKYTNNTWEEPNDE